MRLADELERRRLNDTFAALRGLPERSGSQEAVALRVRDELTDLGFEVEGDPLGPVPVSLLCRLPGPAAELPAAESSVAGAPASGRGPRPVAAVVPTVVLGARLDADAALLLAVAHRARMEPLPCGVELLFTVGDDVEGPELLADLDAARLTSAYGFFFDHAGPFGELVTASPATYRLEVDFHRRPDAYREDEGGAAVRAAARTVLVGVHGRPASDPVVTMEEVLEADAPGTDPARGSVRLLATVRSLDEAAAEQTVADLVDRCYDAGNEPESACDVDVVVTRLAGGLRHGPGQPAVRVAEAALRRCGHEPRRVIGDRSTDADRLTAAGVWCVRLARGSRGGAGTGSPDELDELLDLVLTLLDEAAA